MTVDILSSIKGAKPSQAVNELFDVIKNANPTSSNLIQYKNAVSLDDLREDIVVKSAVIEREIIKENFPRKKDGYLVVAKIID
jgi:Asp-tRNA(Asn)/Glu-tRNA(Gln) amidotransferase C subunit